MSTDEPVTYPLFLRLRGKRVLVIGAGRVAAGKLTALRAAGANVVVVAPDVSVPIRELADAGAITLRQRPVEPADIEDAWFVVAAATHEVNRTVHAWAEALRVFVLAVDDVPSTDAFSPAVFARGGVRIALSSEGRAPALVGLLREALEHALPDDETLDQWMQIAISSRAAWKRDGIPLAERRSQLLTRLASAKQAQSSAIANGSVTLVGAGPGALDLLTVRATRVLASAEVIYYDALVNDELLTLAPNARLVFVGKRAGRPSMAQDTITKLLIRAARRGQRVVRLKSGDPFVFGRGGEEVLDLARAGIPYEIVPGVSSALAAPAVANIPVTHRGLASGMVLLTGEPEETWRQVLADLTPRSVTVVMLMGLRKRDALVESLLARGWPATTPAAVILSATTADETRIFTTLADLATADLPTGAPGVIVIGDVVTVAHQLDALAADIEVVA